jgi:hypothetical protein
MNATKYALVVGKNVSGELQNALTTGTCFLNEGDDFYTLKLMMFPGHSYFVVKNRNSQDRYTIYSKRFREGDRFRFQSPVGSGRLNSELSTHMEIYFPVFQTQMFMSLYPEAV